MSKVKIIAHPETGALFTETKSEDWFKCQVQSEELSVNNGVINLNKRIAFPLVSKAVAEALKGMKSGDTFPLPGRIVRKLTSVPQFDGHKEVVNPTTGETMGYYQSYTFSSNEQEADVDERTTTTVTATAEVVPANSAIA